MSAQDHADQPFEGLYVKSALSIVILNHEIKPHFWFFEKKKKVNSVPLTPPTPRNHSFGSIHLFFAGLMSFIPERA